VLDGSLNLSSDESCNLSWEEAHIWVLLQVDY
jgi:hypothetical protein